MKRLICLMTAILMLLHLAGCGMQSKWPGYSGSMEEYEYCYSEGRARLWEEDILYFADIFLNEHPTLTDEEFIFWTAEESPADGEMVRSKDLYREDIRTEFLNAVNQLILNIPDLTDTEISFEASRIVSLVGDAHSRLTCHTGKLLPIWLDPVVGEDGTCLCAAIVPEGLEHLLGARLVEVNGVSTEHIVKELTPYVPYENDYWPIRMIASTRYVGLVQSRSALTMAGAAKLQDETAELTFETADGYVTETIAYVPWDQREESACVKHSMLTEESIRFHQEDSYWYEVLDTDNGPAVYVRFRAMQYDVQLLRGVLNGVTKLLRDAQEPMKLILDIRGNGGGNSLDNDIANFCNNVNLAGTSGTYILIDSGCFSAAVRTAYVFGTDIEGAVLVGTPTGQSCRSFGNYANYATPNYSLNFCVSQDYFRLGPDADAVYPDITVYQTWEDYQDGIDTVLEYVLALN